jgi:hypothetical protein
MEMVCQLLIYDRVVPKSKIGWRIAAVIGD